MLQFLLSQYTDNILVTLDVFWKGILGIFLVIGLLALIVFVLNKTVNHSQAKIAERKKLIADKEKAANDEKETSFE